MFKLALYPANHIIICQDSEREWQHMFRETRGALDYLPTTVVGREVDACCLLRAALAVLTISNYG